MVSFEDLAWWFGEAAWRASDLLCCVPGFHASMQFNTYQRAHSASRIVTSVAIAVFVVLAVQSLLGATRIGVSNDEPGHQSRMNVWFDTGWYLPQRFMDGRQPLEDIDVGRLHAYGAAYSIFGHSTAVLLGAERWGTTERTAEAYVARGIAVALLGISAALAVGWASSVATGTRVVGIWAAAAVMALPLWTGYSMFAVKDVPSGAGWTFVTAALIVALHPSEGWRRPIAVFLMSAAGGWFSVGVRTALWVPLTTVILVFAALIAARGVARLRTNVVAAAAGVVGGLAGVAALHYRNLATPIEWVTSAVRISGDFHWTGATLSAGQLVTEKPPWWYLPAWIGGSLPLLIGALAIAGGVSALLLLARRGGWRERLSRDAAPVLLWGMQGTMLPLVATVGDATMYAGLRQHLYVLPAFAALASYGAWRLVRRPWRWVPALLILALLVPTFEQSQLFPYQFTYKNLLNGPVDDRWESDMHFVSGREALTRVPATAQAWCYHQSIRLLSGKLRQPGRNKCINNLTFAPFTHEQGINAAKEGEDGQIWVVGRKYRGSPIPVGCVDADSVTRPLRSEEVTLSYVLLCDPEVYDSG